MSASDAPETPRTTAIALGLASLPDAGPARRLALHRSGPAEEVWAEVLAGRAARLPGVAPTFGTRGADLPGRWARAAACIDVDDLLRVHRRADVGVAVLGSDTMPRPLADDLEPPSLICFRGDLDAISGPRVAIVGTRRCTRYGRDVADELGQALAEAGVAVVSGLAMGIDAAAHRGVLRAGGAPPIGVVATGLDEIYPPSSSALWGDVAGAGVLLTEHVLGTTPRTWQFPSRNRIIAALADVVVVVESRVKGGSLYTVREAESRGRGVMAVPGPIRSAASAGTNALLRDGVGVVCDVADVLLRLGLGPAVARSSRDPRVAPTDAGRSLLEALGWQPAVLDDLVRRTGLAVAEVADELDALVTAGWITQQGLWVERRARPE